MNLYDKFDDTRGQNGVGSQLNIWDETLKKYVLLIPLETVPSVIGSTDTVEVDLLTSSMKTKIEGKTTIDDKDVSFLWHRDNVKRLSKFRNKQCKFLVSYPDFTGWKFEGRIRYRPDDAQDDKLTGTFTIIANKVDEYETEDVRDLMAKTCVIDSIVPSIMTIKKSGTKELEITAISSSATFSCESTLEGLRGNVLSNKLTITAPASTGYGILTIKASAEGMASWETTIAIEVVDSDE